MPFLSKINLKYLSIAGALLVVMVILYFLLRKKKTETPANTPAVTQKITETAVFVALAVVLDLVFDPILKMPYGGHLSPAMAPLLIIAFRHGGFAGIAAGVIYGILNYLLGGHPSLFFDYILAFGVIGIAGFFKKGARNPIKCVFIMLFVFFLRYLSHVLSGIIIWQRGILFSLGYNITYLLPSIITTIVIILLLHTRGLIYYGLKTDFSSSKKDTKKLKKT